MKTTPFLSGILVILISLLFHGCHWGEKPGSMPVERILVNESGYPLSFTVWNPIDFTGNDFVDNGKISFHLAYQDSIVFEGKLYWEHLLEQYTGLGWIEADSMAIFANDSLKRIYKFSETCKERNPLILPRSKTCAGYHWIIGETGQTFRFVILNEDFINAEVIKD